MKNISKQLACLVISFLMFMFVGCQNSAEKHSSNNIPNYKVLEYDYSDSISGAKHTREYTFLSEGDDHKYSTNDISVTVGGKTVAGKYKQTSHRLPNNYLSRDYLDEEGRRFSVDDTGLLDFYFWGYQENDNADKHIYTEYECIEIARNFVEQLIDSDAYVVEINEHTNIAAYEVVFTKYLNGYKTTDSATVIVQKNGCIYSYSATMLGRLPNTSDIEVNKDLIVQAVYGKLDKIYNEVKDHYSSVTYGSPDIKYTVLENDRLALYGFVEVEFERDIDGLRINQRERIILIIEL